MNIYYYKNSNLKSYYQLEIFSRFLIDSILYFYVYNLLCDI